MLTDAGRGSSSLNAPRRARELSELAEGLDLDVLVVGGGVTGAGIALDAVSRGLSVALAEKHDLAFGTSRWSSKLIHGGLRYLATGNIGIARECAIERGILLQHTAPHLVRPLPLAVPVFAEMSRREYAVIRAAFLTGDALRMSARTSRLLLPLSRRKSGPEGLRWAPTLRRAGLRGVILAWDGQVVDDARLVVGIARTAAGLGARILTRCAAENLTRSGATLRDQLTGEAFEVRAAVVVNAAGVWAPEVSADVHLRPSRGSHLVVSRRVLGESAAGPTAELAIPVPGDLGRFVYAVPAGDGRVHVGVSDVDAPGPVPDVATPDESEIDFLLSQVNSALEVPIRRDEVLGTFAGLRPLVDVRTGRSADVTRDFRTTVGPDGVLSVVGGKLTTYRAMAEQAVDRVVEMGAFNAGPCRTRRLPLIGAADRSVLRDVRAPRRLVDLYGTEATRVIAEAGRDPGLVAPLAPGIETTAAELRYAVRHEGALDEADLLDRRTRIGLAPADGRIALRAALEALVESGDGGPAC
jgi:glycerol-3-phosphate dehydrogenase